MPQPPVLPVPSVGRIVRYRLAEHEVAAIKRDREILKDHKSNDVRVGQSFPMVIVEIHGHDADSYVNGRCFLDGLDDIWITSVKVGEGPGTWSWPERQ